MPLVLRRSNAVVAKKKQSFVISGDPGHGDRWFRTIVIAIRDEDDCEPRHDDHDLT
jgi:hypothetical protein